jgi:hypothetical protein
LIAWTFDEGTGALSDLLQVRAKSAIDDGQVDFS